MTLLGMYLLGVLTIVVVALVIRLIITAVNYKRERDEFEQKVNFELISHDNLINDLCSHDQDYSNSHEELKARIESIEREQRIQQEQIKRLIVKDVN